MTDNIIAIRNITLRYPKTTELALRGVTLDIRRGEFFGLLGPNGCGKTTLISTITGLLHATSGTITVDGYNTDKQINKIKPLIGLAPQEIALYQTLSLAENLHYFGKLYGLSGARLKDRVEACLHHAKLEQVAQRPIAQFSGGMKRRANLVLGLIHQPKILFLDEPTVNVDPQSRQVIFDMLTAINQQGTTLIYTTHYLEEAQQMCHRASIMDHGTIIACDTPQQLIQQTPNSRNLGDVFLQLTGRYLRD